MKTKVVTILGKEYHMALTCEAMFRIMEETAIENPGEMISHITREGRDALKTSCKVAQILSEEAQAVRAYKGYEKGEVVVESLYDDLLHVSFGEQIAVRRDLAEVIAGGFEREKPGEDEEIDLGLEELKKKKRSDPKNHASDDGTSGRSKC